MAWHSMGAEVPDENERDTQHNFGDGEVLPAPD